MTITNNTNNTNTKPTKPRLFYALAWSAANAYRYDDDAIRAIGDQIAQVRAFRTKARRDAFVDNTAYAEPISARRAYKIGLCDAEIESREYGYTCYDDAQRAQLERIAADDAHMCFDVPDWAKH